MARISRLVVGALLLVSGVAADEAYTPKHEAGRCAMRGHCGKKSWFGKQLPCVDNELATTPDPEFAKNIEAVCGAKWKDSKVCCSPEQVRLVLISSSEIFHVLKEFKIATC